MQQIQSFVKQTVGLEKQFYKLLLTQDFDRFHRCFFEYEKDNEIKNQYCLFESLQDKKLQIWNQINSGIKYSLIFNYIISKNKINRINLTDLSQKHETSFAQLFVRYPGDDEIYNHVREKSFTYKYEGEDISFCSQITLDLNQSLVHQNWQKQFQSYLIKSQEMNKLQYFYDFSFDMRMGDKNMYKEIKKNQKPKLWTRDQFFISKLREFQDNQKTDILLNCSGCGPLIRSVGLFEFIPPEEYDKILQNVYLKADTEQYAPDVLFLAFHTLSKGRKSNMDIFDILLETCLINFNSNLHGPILATILSSYDFNYHENYFFHFYKMEKFFNLLVNSNNQATKNQLTVLNQQTRKYHIK
ncbi:hypothetical protein ABPG74_003879 [Tetrahymena malaccensis]